MEEMKNLPWLDRSTADAIEKARRVLNALIKPDAVYFFDDGYPRYSDIKTNAGCVLAVLNILAEANKGAAVIANAAGAEIAALRGLLREIAAVKRYDPNNGKRREPYPARNLTLNVGAELLERVDALLAGTPHQPEGHILPTELTPPVRRILGMMLWETGPIAGALRAAGKQINNRAEDEQAAVLHWLLGFALEHGMNWEKPAAAALLKMTQGIKD